MQPNADRPWMPGYGLAETDDGLLPWVVAEDRLRASHDYWVSSWSDAGGPHLMPVWGLWQDDALWFSSSDRSRKTRNLTDDPRVSVASDDPHHPIVIQGRATAAIEPGERHAFARSLDAKYATNYGAEFYFESTVFKVIPAVVIAFDDSGLDQTATRWRF